METSCRDELIFWFNAPPNIAKGAINEVSKIWGKKVMYICLKDFSEERRKTNWGSMDNGEAEMILFNQRNDKRLYFRNIINQYPRAIHIFPGFFTKTGVFLLRYLLFMKENARFIIYSEKPCLGGGFLKRSLKRIIDPIRFRLIRIIYQKRMHLLLPLGQQGEKYFSNYGWQKEKMIPFMYCPEKVDVEENVEAIESTGIVRFLYVGRFSYQTRGLDVLIRAFNKLNENGWRLDLVGGYGDKAGEVMAWAESKPNVRFLGTWPANQVSMKMRDYDVCIIPTKIDGWNVQVNEALNAGIGVITTDAAVSDEMVTSSGAGIVVSSNDIDALHEAITHVIRNPFLIEEWKQKAREYAHRISPETVGQYLVDILDYAFYKGNGIKMKPDCPWL